MKFQVNRDVLADSVAFAARMLQSKPTSQVLSGMRLVADANSLQISVFDHDVSAQTEVVANVESSGTTLVSGRLLNDIVSRLPNQPVTFTLDGSKVLLSCGTSKFELATLPIEQYPTLPPIPPVSGTIDGDAFVNAIRRVSVASAKDSTRAFQKGIQIKADNESVMFTAADPNRIARCKVNWLGKTGEVSAVVLTKTMQDIEKSFVNLGEVSISISPEGERGMVAFQAKNRIVTTVVLNIENYPDIDQYFPTNLEDSVVINKQDLIDATKRVELVINESDDTVRYSFETNSVQLESTSSENNASELVEATLTGNPTSLRFKPGLFIDGLNQILSEFVKIEFTKNQRDPSRPGPIIMSSQTSKDAASPDSYRYLLNPNMLKR
ncbi:MAG: DNA polymerase III subunit beta [Microbacteriaceae bacterium]|nr:DNA polymerase III subunit beta [Microbacteriaceae bacterium]